MVVVSEQCWGSLLSELLVTHYLGIVSLDAAETKQLRAKYAELYKQATEIRLDEDLVTRGKVYNVVVAYRFARESRNKKLLLHLNTVVDKLSSAQKTLVLEQLGSLSLLKKQEPSIVLLDESFDYNCYVNGELSFELGVGNWRFGKENGVAAVRARLAERTASSFVRIVREISIGMGIKQDALQKRLACLRVVILYVRRDDSFVSYDEEARELVVSPKALYVNKAELYYGLVREAVRFLQYLEMPYIRHERVIGNVARINGNALSRLAIEDLIYEMTAEVIALGTIERKKWNGWLHDSNKIHLLCALIRYLHQVKKLSLDGSVKFCLNVGLPWMGRVPAAKQVVHCLSPFVGLGLYELDGALSQYAADIITPPYLLEIVINSINSVLAYSVTDANIFMRSGLDMNEHMERFVAPEVRQELTDFIVSYQNKEGNDLSLEKVFARVLVGLKEVGVIVHETCIQWATERLVRNVFIVTCQHSHELVDVREADVYAYIQRAMQEEFVGCRKRLNAFKRAFIGTSKNKKESGDVFREMFVVGNTPCAKRWNSLINGLYKGECDARGIPKIMHLVERLRRDGISNYLADDGVGANVSARMGWYVACRALFDFTQECKTLLDDDKKNFLAVSLLAMLYGMSGFDSMTPEIRLGAFIASYFGAEESIVCPGNGVGSEWQQLRQSA